MKQYAILTSALITFSACAQIDPLEPQSFGEFIMAPGAEEGQPILPSGVAVLHDYPKCGFMQLGEVRATNYQIDITPSRIKKLREQAAQYGADAIIVHPNLPVCQDGEHPPMCPGRGQYVIATAINYLDDPQPTALSTPLEYDFKRGYDTIEFVNPENL